MNALGLTIEVRMNAASLPLRTLSRSGPTCAVEPASLRVWQPLQPLSVKSFLPAAATCAGLAPAGAAGLGLRVRNRLEFFAVTTWTEERMVPCPNPHSSAQTTG